MLRPWLLVVVSGLDYDASAGVRRMYDELYSSIGQYSDDWKKQKSSFKFGLVHDRDDTIWHLDGRLYVAGDFFGNDTSPATMTKKLLHLRFMRAILEKRQMPNFFYKIVTNSLGAMNWNCHKMPTFAIARFSEDQACPLFPNPYFGHLWTEWENKIHDLQAASRAVPFSQRDPRVFWRGAIHAPKLRDDCVTYGSRARLEAATLTDDYPDAFDILPTSCGGHAEAEYVVPCTNLARNLTRNITLHCKKGPRVEKIDMVKATVFLGMPGASSGSYASSLQDTWYLGGVVALWRSRYRHYDAGALQWYSPALVDNVTHVVIDRDAAPDIVSDLLNDPARLESLRRNAALVAETFVCPKCVEEYVIRAIFAILDRLTYIKDVLNPRVCDKLLPILEHFNSCDDSLALFEVTGPGLPSFDPHGYDPDGLNITTGHIVNISSEPVYTGHMACRFLAGCLDRDYDNFNIRRSRNTTSASSFFHDDYPRRRRQNIE